VPKTDPALAKQMPDTISSLREVVEELGMRGVSKQKIANSAGWSPGYLSQALKEKRVPGPEKMRDLIRALHILSGSQHTEVRERLLEKLGPLADRYQAVLKDAIVPTGLISADAPNFIAKPEVARFLERHIRDLGVYLLDGPPMVGLTTSLRLAASALRDHGYEVLQLSVKRHIVGNRFLEKSRAPRILGAIAANLQGGEDGTPDFTLGYAARGFIRDHFRTFPRGFVLVVDELDALPVDDLDDLVAFLRDWRENRADGEAGFVNAGFWGTFTSDTSNVIDRSRLDSDTNGLLEWFKWDEVALLATKLAPKAVGDDTPRAWAETVAKDAWAHFAGQPQLTHQYLWDRTLPGMEYDPASSAPPIGRYKAHLDRLCDTMLGVFGGEARAREVVSLVASRQRLPPNLSMAEVQRLRIVGKDDSWSSPFYKKHVPTHLELRISKQQDGLDRVSEAGQAVEPQAHG